MNPCPTVHPYGKWENVLISPHCTDETDNPSWLELSMQVFVENFYRFQNGDPLKNVVDKRAGY